VQLHVRERQRQLLGHGPRQPPLHLPRGLPDLARRSPGRTASEAPRSSLRGDDRNAQDAVEVGGDMPQAAPESGESPAEPSRRSPVIVRLEYVQLGRASPQRDGLQEILEAPNT
jgi:hypothetical protein